MFEYIELVDMWLCTSDNLFDSFFNFFSFSYKILRYKNVDLSFCVTIEGGNAVTPHIRAGS